MIPVVSHNTITHTNLKVFESPEVYCPLVKYCPNDPYILDNQRTPRHQYHDIMFPYCIISIIFIVKLSKYIENDISYIFGENWAEY